MIIEIIYIREIGRNKFDEVSKICCECLFKVFSLKFDILDIIMSVMYLIISL